MDRKTWLHGKLTNALYAELDTKCNQQVTVVG